MKNQRVLFAIRKINLMAAEEKSIVLLIAYVNLLVRKYVMQCFCGSLLLFGINTHIFFFLRRDEGYILGPAAAIY